MDYITTIQSNLAKIEQLESEMDEALQESDVIVQRLKMPFSGSFHDSFTSIMETLESIYYDHKDSDDFEDLKPYFEDLMRLNTKGNFIKIDQSLSKLTGKRQTLKSDFERSINALKQYNVELIKDCIGSERYLKIAARNLEQESIQLIFDVCRKLNLKTFFSEPYQQILVIDNHHNESLVETIEKQAQTQYSIEKGFIKGRSELRTIGHSDFFKFFAVLHQQYLRYDEIMI